MVKLESQYGSRISKKTIYDANNRVYEIFGKKQVGAILPNPTPVVFCASCVFCEACQISLYVEPLGMAVSCCGKHFKSVCTEDHPLLS